MVVTIIIIIKTGLQLLESGDPEGFPTPRRPDAVHGRRTLNASGMGGIEEHERPLSLGRLFDFLTQQRGDGREGGVSKGS